MMTRENYMQELAYNLSEEACLKYFSVPRDALQMGSATWNQALEYAYQEYLMCEEG